MDPSRGLDRGRSVAGALETGGQRHGEATGVGGADQLLGVGARPLLATGRERVLTLERPAPEAHGSLPLLVLAFPPCRRSAFGHSLPPGSERELGHEPERFGLLA